MNESIKIKMMKEYEETQLKQTIEDLYAKLPQCNILLEAPLLQKVKIRVARAKDLEETIEKMDAEHKASMAKLESRAPRKTPEECKDGVVELQGYATIIETRLAET